MLWNEHQSHRPFSAMLPATQINVRNILKVRHKKTTGGCNKKILQAILHSNRNNII